MALMTLHQELERRDALYALIDLALDKHFIFLPNEYKPRLRRNEVHKVVMEEWGMKETGNWRIKRLIKDRLAVRGVRFVIQEGKRMFVGLEYKNGKPRQAGLHSRKRSRNKQNTGISS